MSKIAGMKILQCYVTAEFGGLASTVATIANSLRDEGCQNSLALQRPEGEVLGRISPKIPIYNLGYTSPYSYPRMLIEMIKVVRYIRPHLLISHAWHTSVLAIIASYLCYPRPRILLFEHTSPEFYHLGSRWRGRLIELSLSTLYRKADSLIVVSEEIHRIYRDRFRIPNKRIRVIPPPVNISSILEQAKEAIDHPWFTENQPVILSAGALNPVKDFPTLLKSFAEVRRVQSAKLVIIGDGPERTELEALAAESGIADDFCVLGYQPNPYKYMARAKIFVLPSIIEGFGKVIVEALALGIPVLSTDCAGPKDILMDDRYGLLSPKRNSNAMAQTILSLLNDNNLFSSLKRSGPYRASIYDINVVLRQIKEVIGELTDF